MDQDTGTGCGLANAGSGQHVLAAEELFKLPEEGAAEGEEAEWAEELESGRAGGESLCWVYYTSGSTGRPKGVLCEHRNAIAYLRAHPFLLGLLS